MLHELVNYARNTGLDSEPGFKPRWVRWLLIFDSDGRFLRIVDFKSESRKGREFAKCPDLSQGEMVSSASRHFLVDSVDKIAMLVKDEVTQRDETHHASYVGLLKAAAVSIPALAKIADTLNDETSLAKIREQLTEKKAKPTDSCTIAVMEGTLPKILSKAPTGMIGGVPTVIPLLLGRKMPSLIPRRTACAAF